MKFFAFFKRIPRTKAEKQQSKKERILLLVSGVFLGLAFPPIPLPYLIFAALIPYLFVIEKRETLLGVNQATYLTAFIFGVITLYWVGGWTEMKDPFLLIGGGLLLFINPVLFLIPSTIYYYARKYLGKHVALLLLPFFWVTYEYAYMITEATFPWLTLGNALPHFLTYIQIADIVGVLGLSLLVVACNVFLYITIRDYLQGKGITKYALISALLIFIIPMIYGVYQRATYKISDETITVGVVQPDFDPYYKWSGGLNALLSTYIELSKEVVADGADIVFWPETALPVYLMSGQYGGTVGAIQSFVRENNVYLLTGMPHIRYYPNSDKRPPDARYNEFSNRYYTTHNSLLHFSPDADTVIYYGKMKLVPFGERAPFLDQIPLLGELLKWSVGLGNWNFGRDTVVFPMRADIVLNDSTRHDSLYTSGLICFESVFPILTAEFAQRGAEFFTIVTNDSWYGKTSGPYQHKEIAVLRAIENRKSVVRCANGGVSCIIDALGNISNETDMYVRTSFVGEVPIEKSDTFYSRNAALIPLLSSVVSLWVIGLSLLLWIKKKMYKETKSVQNV